MDDGMVLLPNDRYPLDRGGVPPLLHLRRQGTDCRHRISAAL
ncbi:hypothetical protein [Bacteroides ilei]